MSCLRVYTGTEDGVIAFHRPGRLKFDHVDHFSIKIHIRAGWENSVSIAIIITAVAINQEFFFFFFLFVVILSFLSTTTHPNPPPSPHTISEEFWFRKNLHREAQNDCMPREYLSDASISQWPSLTIRSQNHFELISIPLHISPFPLPFSFHFIFVFFFIFFSQSKKLAMCSLKLKKKTKKQTKPNQIKSNRK